MATGNKVAVVTGSSRGIGKASSIHLARKGFDVVICARTIQEGEAFEHSSTVKKSNTKPIPGSLESTAAEIRKLGRRVLTVKADLLKREDLKRLVDTTMAEFGRIDVLVNNARYIGPGHMDLFIDTPIELFDDHFACNVLAPLYLMKLAVPVMMKQGGGIIINLSSGAGYREVGTGMPGELGGIGLGYGVSKAAFNRIAAGLAKELREHKIAVINLDPGYVSTERMKTDMAAFGRDSSKGASLDVPASVCAFLATYPYPMFYSGQEVFAPNFAMEHSLVDPKQLPATLAPSTWGLPRA